MAIKNRRFNKWYLSLFPPSLLFITLTLFWLIIFIPVLFVSALFVSTQSVQAAQLSQSYTNQPYNSSDPLALAFYYTWFDENTWTYKTLSDLPASLYNSRDRTAMGRHIEQAQQAGIDAFLVAWYGPSPNPTETNLMVLLDEAAARNFKIGILFESDSPLLYGASDISNALLHAQGIHAQHPAYLRVDGRPVIFFWRPHIYSVATWQQIRTQVDPGHSMIWISEGVEMAYLQVFDGHHLYSNSWNPPTDLNYTNQKFARWVNNARQQHGTHKYWVATAMPGYNDVRIRPQNGFATDREQGAYYARSWQSAIDSNPDWIVITSFNEWPEGTYIEPSVLYGQQYLDLTRTWTQQFKIDAAFQPVTIQQPVTVAPVPAAPTAALPIQVQAASAPIAPVVTAPVVTVPMAYVQATMLNLRQGPGTHYAISAQIPAGTALPIISYHPGWPEWWRVEYGGLQGWVYAPLVQTAGPLDQIPIFHISLK